MRKFFPKEAGSAGVQRTSYGNAGAIRQLRVRVLGTLVLLAGVVLAQGVQVVVKLKNGNSVKGILVYEVMDTLYIRTAQGQAGFPRSHVLRIDYAPAGDQSLSGTETQGASRSKLFHAEPKKDACLGCFLSWLIPGTGMLYAGKQGWAALYFLGGAALSTWVATRHYSPPYDVKDYVPGIVLVAVRIIENVHTYTVIEHHNWKYGWTFNWDRYQRTTGVEYRFAPVGTSMQPVLALEVPTARPDVRVGMKVRF